MRQLKKIFGDQRFCCVVIEDNNQRVHHFHTLDADGAAALYRWMKEMEKWKNDPA